MAATFWMKMSDNTIANIFFKSIPASEVWKVIQTATKILNI